MLNLAEDTRPPFRDDDVEAMRYALDLSDHEHVRTYVESIDEHSADGSMPCDGAWPAEQLALFRRWVDDGGAP